MKTKKFSESARKVIEIEGNTILGLLDKVDANFERACEILFIC